MILGIDIYEKFGFVDEICFIACYLSKIQTFRINQCIFSLSFFCSEKLLHIYGGKFGLVYLYASSQCFHASVHAEPFGGFYTYRKEVGWAKEARHN